MLIITVYSMQSISNTFQGILISNGTSSYAVFIYDCTNMEWGGGVIGWQQSTTQYASHSNSGLISSNEAVCGFQTISFTSLVYRIEGGECTSVPSLSYTDCISLSLWVRVPQVELNFLLSFLSTCYLSSTSFYLSLPLSVYQSSFSSVWRGIGSEFRYN